MKYLGNDLKTSDDTEDQNAFRRKVESHAKFSVNAKFSEKNKCKVTGMFDPSAVSIQAVNDGNGAKEWAMLIALDWSNRNGYLYQQVRDEDGIGKCRSLPYLPYTEMRIQVYLDGKKCCGGTKDYTMCNNGCFPTPLAHHWKKEPLAYKMVVKGSIFFLHTDRYILEGTKYTSPVCMNYLRFGKNVNDGDVRNAVCKKDNPSSFIEVDY